MHDGLDRGEGVEVCVCGDLLGVGNVVVSPTEKPANRCVNDMGVDRCIQEVFPRYDGGQDSFPAKKEEDQHRAGKMGESRHTMYHTEKTTGTHEAFTSPSTMDVASPSGLIAGASAMNTFTFPFSWGWMLSAANACAVPWLNPI